jgi:hypothetical protein
MDRYYDDNLGIRSENTLYMYMTVRYDYYDHGYLNMYINVQL